MYKTGESPQLIAFNAANANNVDVQCMYRYNHKKWQFENLSLHLMKIYLELTQQTSENKYIRSRRAWI